MKVPRLLCIRMLLVLILGALLSSSIQAQVFISEFLASNSNGLEDEDGDTSDWIELYNPSDAVISLEGWYLTDDADVLTKWRFPAVSIAPKGFLIVFASGKDRAVAGAPLHTSFSLDAAGEYLALVWPDGTNAVSSFAPKFPDQPANVSYGYAQEMTTRRIVASNHIIKYFIPTGAVVGDWRVTGYDDSSWATGTNGLGYDTTLAGFAIRAIKANVGVSNLFQADDV